MSWFINWFYASNSKYSTNIYYINQTHHNAHIYFCRIIECTCPFLYRGMSLFEITMIVLYINCINKAEGAGFIIYRVIKIA
jgi:hypothetical protein